MSKSKHKRLRMKRRIRLKQRKKALRKRLNEMAEQKSGS